MGWVVAVLGADGSVVWVWLREGFAPLREGSARRAPGLPPWVVCFRGQTLAAEARVGGDNDARIGMQMEPALGTRGRRLVIEWTAQL